MFWRKKKIPFRDWALSIILGDLGTGPQIHFDLARVAAVESMKFGIAVGAQFPTKVMPMIRQVSGDNANNTYAQMKESLQSWVDANAETGIELESYPLITDMVNKLQTPRIPRTVSNGWSVFTFFYGLLMGSLYRELFSEALASSIHYGNLQWELVKESAPADLASTPLPSYQGFLSDAKDMVIRYEREHGALL